MVLQCLYAIVVLGRQGSRNLEILTNMNVLLDVKSWYSLLEGLDPPERLVEKAVESGYQAVALTDVNSIMGLPAFVESASRLGIRSITGATLAHPRLPQCPRVIALAGAMEGYAELCALITQIKRLEESKTIDEGDFLSLLLQNSKDLRFLVEEPKWLAAFQKSHGNRTFGLVVRSQTEGVSGRAKYLESILLEQAMALGLKSVVSSRVTMADPKRAVVEPLLRAIRTRGIVDLTSDGLAGLGVNAMKNALCTPQALQHRFRDLPRLCQNTIDLFGDLESNVLPSKILFPTPREKWKVSGSVRLRHLCKRGMGRRGYATDAEANKRLALELGLIERLGFTGYFLVVRSIAKKARRMGMSMALRGSAGNSLVCFLLEITEVDPLRFELPLERFLHEGRTDLPDIDLDFDWKTRDSIIDWAIRHFGEERTCRISSHLFFQPRSALRESCRAFGLSNDQIGHFFQSISQSAEELLENPIGAKKRGVPFAFPLEGDRWWRILEGAVALLGMPHHLSIHPGGIVMVSDRIDHHVPIQRSSKGVDVTQFDKYSVESTGLVKIDLLGNRALATVDEVARRMTNLGRVPPQMLETDPSVLKLLRAGESLGVGQLESPGMKHLLIQMAPKGIDDVILALALIRPGAAGIGMKAKFCARRRGLEEPAKQHPVVANLLKSTEGMMIFEDDGLRLLQGLCGFSAPEADRFRKKVAKNHDPKVAAILREEFVNRGVKSGVSLLELHEIWPQLEKFNQYSFCKSHAVSYGLIAWRSAWCKANEPVLFWTAALNNNAGMYPRRVYVGEIVRSGITMLGPCVNRSVKTFEPEGKGIRTGFGSIAGLAMERIEEILNERNDNGLFTSAESLQRRTGMTPDTMDRLRKAGALDGFGQSRPTLALQGELKRLAHWQTKGAELFEQLPDLEWVMGPLDSVEKSRQEYPLLGMTISQPLHQLMEPVIQSGLQKAGIDPTERRYSSEIRNLSGGHVIVAGMVAAARATTTKSGKPMQFLTLEDCQGFVDLTVFPGDCPLLQHITEGPYLGIGIVEEEMGVFTVRAKRVVALHGKGNVITIQDESRMFGLVEEEL